MSGQSSEGSGEQGIDYSVRPDWMRTGYRYFPYAAWEADQWWVLRANYCFPEHDLATLCEFAELNPFERDERGG